MSSATVRFEVSLPVSVSFLSETDVVLKVIAGLAKPLGTTPTEKRAVVKRNDLGAEYSNGRTSDQQVGIT